MKFNELKSLPNEYTHSTAMLFLTCKRGWKSISWPVSKAEVLNNFNKKSVQMEIISLIQLWQTFYLFIFLFYFLFYVMGQWVQWRK